MGCSSPAGASAGPDVTTQADDVAKLAPSVATCPVQSIAVSLTSLLFPEITLATRVTVPPPASSETTNPAVGPPLSLPAIVVCVMRIGTASRPTRPSPLTSTAPPCDEWLSTTLTLTRRSASVGGLVASPVAMPPPNDAVLPAKVTWRSSTSVQVHERPPPEPAVLSNTYEFVSRSEVPASILKPPPPLPAVLPSKRTRLASTDRPLATYMPPPPRVARLLQNATSSSTRLPVPVAYSPPPRWAWPLATPTSCSVTVCPVAMFASSTPPVDSSGPPLFATLKLLSVRLPRASNTRYGALTEMAGRLRPLTVKNVVSRSPQRAESAPRSHVYTPLVGGAARAIEKFPRRISSCDGNASASITAARSVHSP